MTAAINSLQTVRGFVTARAAVAYLVLIAASLPIWPFGWHLALHVLGAIALIGNAVVMAVLLSAAGFGPRDDRKRTAVRAVNRGDVWFTVPGVLLLLLNGIAMASARYGGFPDFLGVDFIAAGLALLSGTGIVWAARLVPTQLAMQRLTDGPGPVDAAAFRRLLIRWSVWGTIATILPIVAVVVMSAKPELW
jgi:uncharacterized membrane protein